MHGQCLQCLQPLYLQLGFFSATIVTQCVGDQILNEEYLRNSTLTGYDEGSAALASSVLSGIRGCAGRACTSGC